MTGPDDKTPVPTPPPEPPKPNVTLVPLGRDPTQPIRLIRPVAPPPPPSAATEGSEAPTPPALPAVTPPEDWKGDDRTVVAPARPEGEWKGDDRTVVGPAATTATPPPAEDWKGDDRTVVTPSTTPRTAVAEEWKGDDRTVVGGPAPKPAAADEDWTGNEATQIGLAPGSGAPKGGGTTTAKVGSGSSTTGSKATSPTLDDAWHFKGRQGPLTGKLIGDYQCGGILGEGGMGTVYRARQISLKRRVALKVLPANLAADLHLRARFEQEARTASLINSVHVVQVFGAGTVTDDQLGEIVYFVMEYVEGTDLAGIIAEKREKGEGFTPEEAAGYIIQAARGLAEAGKHNIVHRDIKPANLMVTAKGVVKIADFGISKVAGEHGMTMTGTTVGTPAYCSPEQGRGDQVDPRADIYSLGVAFYELLSGRKPFDGTTANALIYQHNYQEPKLLTELRPDLPTSYQAVCLKCLMKDPASRYQDAAELVTDLERVRDGNMSVTAVFQAKFGTGADEAMRKYLGHTPWWQKPVTIVAAVVLISLGAGVYLYSRNLDAQAAEAGQIRGELQKRRDRLKVLDAPASVPESAVDDLAFIAKRAPADPDLKRWQDKVARVVALKKSLAPLGSGPLPDAAVRAATAGALADLLKAVGERDADAAAWSARVAEAQRVRDGLRTELSTAFAAALTRARVAELRPRLAEYVRLADAADADAPVWSARLNDFDQRLVDLAKGLGVLDQAKAAIPERTVTSLRADLVRYVAAAGADDPAGVRWATALNGAEGRITALRTAVGEQISVSLGVAAQEQARQLLDDYRALVDASDGVLLTGEARLKAAADRIEALRSQLSTGLKDGRHDQSETELKELDGALAAYAGAAKADDERTSAWRARLRQEQDALATDRAALAKLGEVPLEDLTQAQRGTYDTALKALSARSAITSDVETHHRARLRDAEEVEKQLRSDLNGLRGNREAITDNVENEHKLDRLERIAGRQDPEVAYWVDFLADYRRLRTALADLDQVLPIPARAAENLAAFAKLVSPSNPKIKAWQDKLLRVSDLKERLKGTEQARPLPPKAREHARALLAEVGPTDRQAKLWADKIERVHTLRETLAGILGTDPTSILPGNYVHPGTGPARAASEELLALIGDKDDDVRWWRYRVAVLRGPARPAWAKAYDRDDFGPWAEIQIEGLDQRLRFRYVPAGTFTLGSPDAEAGRDEDETQIPGVTLTRSFWMADAETTQGLWARITGNNPARFSRANDSAERPVERISWDEAKAFCTAFAERVKAEAGVTLRARLPTEAEWEYACRSGSEAPWSAFTGPLGTDKLNEAAWYALGDGTRGVRRRQPNRLGLFDLHGNVWEWCEDRYWTYSAARAIDPVGAQEDTRVARGGSWADTPERLRAANRIALRPDMRTLYVGMRLVIDAEWAKDTEPRRPGTEE